MRLRILLLPFLFPAVCLLAQERPPLPSIPVTLEAKNASVKTLLAGLKEQTGVILLDEIGEARTVPRLQLDRVPFWQAADAIARGARAKLVASPKDGSLRLTRLLPGDREAPASYDGNFRVRLVRLGSTAD